MTAGSEKRGAAQARLSPQREQRTRREPVPRLRVKVFGMGGIRLGDVPDIVQKLVFDNWNPNPEVWSDGD